MTNQRSSQLFSQLKTILSHSYPLILFISVLCFVWLLAKAIWLVVAPPISPQVTPIPLRPPMPQQQITGNVLDFFAKPTAPTVIATQPPPNIKVLGVTVATPEQFSYAILNMDNKTRSYKVGDMLDNSPFKLVKVTKELIVIADQNGKTFDIEFKKKFSLDQSEEIRAKALASNPNTFNQINQLNPQPPIITQSVPILPQNDDDMFEENQDPAVLQKPPLSQAVGELQQNPSAYLNKMGVVSIGNGYQVTDSMPPQIRERLGLQTGDKVISINGQSIGQNPNQDAQLLQQVQQTGQAEIQVQRGEQVITVRQSF